MSEGDTVEVQVEGPTTDPSTGARRYTARSDVRDIGFSVIEEEKGGAKGWAVRIEGVPAPSIVHERPWPTVEAACEAATRAITDMLVLERAQRAELELRKKGM